MKQNGRRMLEKGMTQLIYTSSDTALSRRVGDAALTKRRKNEMKGFGSSRYVADSSPQICNVKR